MLAEAEGDFRAYVTSFAKLFAKPALTIRAGVCLQPSENDR
jgi:hypothetical protein